MSLRRKQLRARARELRRNLRGLNAELDALHLRRDLLDDDMALLIMDDADGRGEGLMAGLSEGIQDTIRRRILELSSLPSERLDDLTAAMVTRVLIPDWLTDLTSLVNLLSDADIDSYDEVREQLISVTKIRTERERLAALRYSDTHGEFVTLIGFLIKAVEGFDRRLLAQGHTRERMRDLLCAFDLWSIIDYHTPIDGESESERLRGHRETADGTVEKMWRESPPTALRVDERDGKLLLGSHVTVPAFTRIYRNPNGYASYKRPSQAYAGFLSNHLAGTSKFPDESCLSLALAISDWPLYWIGIDMLAAAMASDLPRDIDAADVHWPRDAMTFMLPQNIIVEGDGYIEAISLARCTEEIETVNTIIARERGGPAFQHNEPAVICSAMNSVDRALDGNGSMAGSAFTFIALLNGPLSELSFTSKRGPSSAFTNSMMSLAMNLLLIMQARRELITGGEIIGTVKVKRNGRKAKSQLWNPLWIGRDFRISHDHPGHGSHATPRMHWRRGHWRNVVCGPRLTIDRQPIAANQRAHVPQWIEPSLVNAKPSETKTAVAQ